MDAALPSAGRLEINEKIAIRIILYLGMFSYRH